MRPMSLTSASHFADAPPESKQSHHFAKSRMPSEQSEVPCQCDTNASQSVIWEKAGQSGTLHSPSLHLLLLQIRCRSLGAPSSIVAKPIFVVLCMQQSWQKPKTKARSRCKNLIEEEEGETNDQINFMFTRTNCLYHSHCSAVALVQMLLP